MKTECAGSEQKIGMVTSVLHCAVACKSVSSMFAFGTNAYGNSRCSKGKCQCLCETSASSDGTCKEVRHTGYKLYKYSSGVKGNVATKEKPNMDP